MRPWKIQISQQKSLKGIVLDSEVYSLLIVIVGLGCYYSPCPAKYTSIVSIRILDYATVHGVIPRFLSQATPLRTKFEFEGRLCIG